MLTRRFPFLTAFSVGLVDGGRRLPIGGRRARVPRANLRSVRLGQGLLSADSQRVSVVLLGRVVTGLLYAVLI